MTLQQTDPDIEKLIAGNLHWVERPLSDKLGRRLPKNPTFGLV